MPLTATTLLTPFLTGTFESTPGKFVIRNVYIAINATDVSANCHSVTLTQQRAQLEITNLNDTNHQYLPLHRETIIDIALYEDPALYALTANPPVLVEVRPEATAHTGWQTMCIVPAHTTTRAPTQASEETFNLRATGEVTLL
jgi:hypothetical protein